MEEKRRNQRYTTIARVVIEELGNEEGLLKDLSITGCRIELSDYKEVKQHTQYKLKIIPEATSEVEPFLLSVESRWIGTEVDYYEFGFSINEPPKGKQFKRYVDYLSWRYSQGNSMTGDNNSEIL